MDNKELIVVKFGSTSVTNEQGMDQDRLGVYAEHIAQVMEQHNVIVVSSGSINTGKAMWEGEPLQHEEDYAAIGSGRAFTAWQEAFKEQGVAAAQIPVTNHEIDSVEGVVLEQRLCSLARNGILSIANGNDVLSSEGALEYEIDTDNDRLAEHIATLTMAKYLVLLTDRDGLMDGDNVVPSIDVSNGRQWRQSLRLAPAPEPGQRKRHGMRSKLFVSRQFVGNGYAGHAFIARASSDIRAVVNGEAGTHIYSSKSAKA